MGSGSSTTHTAEQKAFIAHSLKEFYEKHKGKGMTDAELQQLLAVEYTKVTAQFQHTKSEVHTEGAAHAHHGKGSETSATETLSTKASNRGFLERQQSTRGGPKKTTKTAEKSSASSTDRPARRRSFDQMPGKKSMAEVVTLAQSLSAVTLPTVNEVVTQPPVPVAAAAPEVASASVAQQERNTDSWDSVSEQPYCDVCKMAFKSMSFLERHRKFSSLHIENEKRKQTGEKAALAPPPPTELTKKEELTVVKQEEGTHYRLLYSGCKFFWRIQVNVDFDIYHHFMARCIEIIPFNSDRHRELPRVYLDYENICELVEPSVAEAVSEKIRTIMVDRFAAKPDETKLREEVFLQKMVTYILQRLNILTPDGECTYVSLFGDNEVEFPVLEEPPVVLVPINVTRRRKSSVEEFNTTMKSMKNDYSEINAKLQKVDAYRNEDKKALEGIKVPVTPLKSNNNYEYSARIANYVYMAATFLSSPKWYQNPSIPKGKRKFIAAIEKVMHNAAVAKTKALLDSKNVPIVYKSPFRKTKISFIKKPDSTIVPNIPEERAEFTILEEK
jgi:hypothetical protein